ncbi:MAG: hypothetical protein ACR2F2_00515 [Pyrinomonadaceae bacterium]
MKNIKFIPINFLLVLIFSVSTLFGANLTADKDKALSLLEQNLSKRLKAELLTENVTIKFTKVQQNELSNSEIYLFGDGLAVLPAEKTELPIKFKAEVNPVEEVVSDVEYTFVESNYATATDEEILMKHLLQKIAADYKTENVVIAIDNFETEKTTDDQKEFKGIGEVRVGEFEWKRIDFDVVLNNDNQAAKVAYQLKK